MVQGRSRQAFKTWLSQRPKDRRDGIEVVAMDGFTGFKTATTEELPDAVTVMDPFHVVRLAGDALDRCRRRIQQIIHGHRGRKDDPLYRARRTLHTGADLLTDKQKDRLLALFAADEHVQVEATWAIYQQMIAAYREPGRTRGRALMVKLIESLSHGVPAALSELITLGRTLKQRGDDVLAYFDRPGTSNGPTEAINGDSSTSAARHSDSATSPTTSPDHCSSPAASDPDYTLDCEEPQKTRDRGIGHGRP
jgi:transposase